MPLLVLPPPLVLLLLLLLPVLLELLLPLPVELLVFDVLWETLPPTVFELVMLPLAEPPVPAVAEAVTVVLPEVWLSDVVLPLAVAVDVEV